MVVTKGSPAYKKQRHEAALKSWDTRGRKKAQPGAQDGSGSQDEGGSGGRPGPQGSRGDWRQKPAGADQISSASMAKSIRDEPSTTTDEAFRPNVEADADGDGITDAARVGVPGKVVPPPPKVPRLPNLDAAERQAETTFADAFEADPDGMAKKYLEMMEASGSNKFETDEAKNLYGPWEGKGLSPEDRATVRSTLNTALHQTANAIAKRAFLMKLDSMTDEEKAKGIFVTVGGCGAGKGFALKHLSKNGMPEFDAKRYGAVWDSAGDQNATENPWILEEAKKRGIKVTYAYVSADPETSWADEKRGVVARAKGTDNGRMVDAAVFADSYVLGARNHAEFARRHAGEASFLYIQNGDNIHSLPGVPDADIKRDRKKLQEFAVGKVAELGELIPPRIRRGATVGQRIWS